MADRHEETGGEKTSIWKKEISFKRKPKEEKPAAAPAEQASIWKKELHLFGASKAEPAPQAAAAQESVWKKEISFKRKPKEERSAPAPATETSVWKKEIRLFGKGKAVAPPPEPEAVAASEPEPAPMVAAEPDPEAAPEPPVVPELPAAVVPEPPPAPELDHSWLTAPLEEVSIPPDELEPLAEAEPEPAPPLLPPVAPEPLPDPAAVVLPPPVVAPPVVVPPVAAPQPAAPPASREAPRQEREPEPKQAKVPLLKRELSFKRKPKAERPKKAEQPKAERPKQAKVPLHKRELSFKRKPKAEQPAAEAPRQAKVPLRKRELSFKRKPRAVAPSAGQAGERRAKEKRLVGLKIGASQIAAARVVNNGSPELLQAVRAPLEPGIVVGGELRDPEALAVALKEFFRRNKLPKRGVRLGVANNRIGVRTFEITGIDDPKQLANAIHYRAQEVLPIPLEEAVLDYQILSETVGEDGQTTRRILLVVAYRDLVERYVSACRKAGIQIVGVDLEAFALLRALAAPVDPAAAGRGAALVAVSVGHDRSTFAVSDGRVCEFTRVLEWGGYSLDVGIARALDVTPIEAAETKRAISLAAPDEPLDGLTDEQAALVREAVQRQLQSFARELVSSLQFYQSQPGSLPIGELVLTGGTAGMPGLAGELERLVGVPVRVGDPLGRVKVSKKVKDRDQSGSLAVAIGLGIED